MEEQRLVGRCPRLRRRNAIEDGLGVDASIVLNKVSVDDVLNNAETQHAKTTISGYVTGDVDVGDQVTIRRSRQKARLVRLEGHSFFETLRHKLHWTGSHA